MMRTVAVIMVLYVMGACGRGEKAKPSGTAADPVDVCERVADVCRIDKARLGVCTHNNAGDGLTCMSQH